MNLTELFESPEGAKAFVVDVVGIIDSLGPEIMPLLQKISDGVCSLKVQQIHAYEAAGFTREEAILLVCDSFAALQEGLRRSSRSK